MYLMDSKTEMVQEGVPPQVVTGQPHPGQPLSVPRDPPAPYVQYTASGGPTAAVVPGVVQQEQLPSSSMVGTIVCSCIVTWFCCLPLGLISFILAMVANKSSNTEKRKSLKTASVALSAVGIILGIITTVVTHVSLRSL